MQLFDTVSLGGTRRTRDGYLVGEAKVGRTGIQVYSGAEVGDASRDTVRVYRPPEEVFAQDAMASVAWRPMTMDHPSGRVTADNWRDLSVGMTGDTVQKDGDFIRVPLTVMDSQAIADIEGGKRELSLGYTCDLDFVDGITPDGQPYDAIQRNIRANHLAICSRARGGPELRIGDGGQQQKDRAMPETTRAVLVDGITYPMTDQGAQLVERLQGLLGQAATKLTDAATAHGTEVANLNAQLAAKDAEIEKLTAQIVTGDALDAMIADRATVIAGARALAPKLDVKGKSNIEIKRAVLGDAVKDKPDAYVDAAFDLKVADLGDGAGSGSDPVLTVVGDSVNLGDAAKAREEARKARLARLQDGHRQADAAA